MDLAAGCRIEAERCRRLAEALGDDPARKPLLAMAAQYEAEARRHDQAGRQDLAGRA